MTSRGDVPPDLVAPVLGLDARLLVERVKLMAWVMLYATLVYATYSRITSVTFGYRGMQSLELPWPQLIVAVVTAGLPTLLVAPISERRPSVLFFWVLYLIVFVPSLVIVPQTLESGVLQLLVALFGNLLLLGWGLRGPMLRLPRLRVSRARVLQALSLIALLGTAALLYRFRNTVQVVSFSDVYGLRSQFLEDTPGTFAGYGFTLLGSAINPLLMSWGLYQRRRVIWVVGSIGQCVLYTIGGHKSIILSVPLILLVWWLLSKRRASIIRVAVIGCVVSSGLILLWHVFGTPDLIAKVLYMRTFHTPAFLTGLYADFFSTHEVTRFGHVNGLSQLVGGSGYDRPIPYVIGEFYFPEISGANANLWADGIAGLGYIGMFVETLVALFTLRLLDSAGHRFALQFWVPALTFHAVNVMNIGIFTMLAGHGLALTIVIIWALSASEAPAGQAREVL